jgi:hypothetical protein
LDASQPTEDSREESSASERTRQEGEAAGAEPGRVQEVKPKTKRKKQKGKEQKSSGNLKADFWIVGFCFFLFVFGFNKFRP